MLLGIEFDHSWDRLMKFAIYLLGEGGIADEIQQKHVNGECQIEGFFPPFAHDLPSHH